jgi:hypothetical protein
VLGAYGTFARHALRIVATIELAESLMLLWSVAPTLCTVTAPTICAVAVPALPTYIVAFARRPTRALPIPVSAATTLIMEWANPLHAGLCFRSRLGTTALGAVTTLRLVPLLPLVRPTPASLRCVLIFATAPRRFARRT